MIRNRTQEERDAIAAEVIAARGAQPLTRAAAQAGISPMTWRRIEDGKTVREDILEIVGQWVADRTHKPPQSIQDATDEQLLAELGRRLASRNQQGATPDGPPMSTDSAAGDGVRVAQEGKRTRVRVESTKGKKRTDQPKGS